MDKLTNLSFIGLQNYFHTLSVFGYKNYREVNKLIALLIIEELLNGYFSSYINNEDYKSITEFLYSLYGSTCLIPYPNYKCAVTFNQALNIPPRVSETSILRFSEDGVLRYALQ